MMPLPRSAIMESHYEPAWRAEDSAVSGQDESENLERVFGQASVLVQPMLFSLTTKLMAADSRFNDAI